MKQSVITGSLGSLGDRFVLEGYKDDLVFADKIKQLAMDKIEKCIRKGDAAYVSRVIREKVFG